MPGTATVLITLCFLFLLGFATSTVLFEVVGPVLTRLGLMRAGEISHGLREDGFF